MTLGQGHGNLIQLYFLHPKYLILCTNGCENNYFLQPWMPKGMNIYWDILYFVSYCSYITHWDTEASYKGNRYYLDHCMIYWTTLWDFMTYGWNIRRWNICHYIVGRWDQSIINGSIISKRYVLYSIINASIKSPRSIFHKKFLQPNTLGWWHINKQLSGLSFHGHSTDCSKAYLI